MRSPAGVVHRDGAVLDRPPGAPDAAPVATLPARRRISVGSVARRSPIVVAPAIISLATAVRVGLIVQGWPELNSDEPTLGLMALHILHHGERPVFEYGQPYMGGIEAYLAALFFQVLGPTTFALRLGNVLLYDLFLATLYLLTSRLYSRTVAFVSLLVLSLGPEELLFRKVEAIGGVQETLFLGCLAMLLAVWLAESRGGGRLRRGIAWSSLGLVAGTAL